MNAQTKLTRARISLLLDEPFFGTLLLNLRQMEDKTGAVPTMATDGERLLWSANLVEKLTERELKTVLAHEVLHPGLLHHIRRGERDPRLWNIAADHAVNLILESCNQEAKAKNRPAPFPWPAWPKPVMDARFSGMSAEAIYDALRQEGGGGSGQNPNGQPGQPGADGEPSLGEVNDAPEAQDEAGKGEQETRWKKAIIDAAQAGKSRGTMPAEMRKLVEDILAPKADWREILRRFIRDRATDDYSWLRPNPRYASTGFILPSLHSQRLGTVGIIRDTSGSTQDWQAEILAELAGVIHEAQPAKVVVIDADAKVQRVLELEPGDALPADALGGGGTDFRPALERMEGFSPVCCVYLTDLAGSFPDHEPSFPVLWATAEQCAGAPFGETIRV